MRKLARPLVQRGDIEGALQALLARAQAHPEDSADALTHAGELALALNAASQRPAEGATMLVFAGDRTRAEELFRGALRAAPSHPQALYGLARLLPATSTERIDALARATAAKPTYLGLLELGDALRSVRNDPHGAYDAYHRAHELDRRDRDAYLKLADTCKSLGREEEAEEWRDKWQKRRQAARPRLKQKVLEVELDTKGWTRCPACNRRFSVANSGVFKDGRHQCGQALSIRSA
jgi:tetratricopeptide (TPR) repeat protein